MTEYDEQIRSLHRRIDQLAHLVERQVRDGGVKIGNLQDKAYNLGKKFRSSYDDWFETATDTIEEVKCQAEEKIDKVRDNVKKNPIVSLGVSVFIGYLIGRIFSRRD